MMQEESLKDMDQRSRWGDTMICPPLLITLCAGACLIASVALGTDPDTSTLTCSQGLMLGIYDTPKEGTKPWRNKHIRCEKVAITCPPLMKPVYHDTEVFGSTAMDDGKFVRCEEMQVPPK